jgi:riboflavin synthase
VFTGRVSEVGTIGSVQHADAGIVLAIHGPASVRELTPGGSVAVAGIRLTVVAVDGDVLSVLLGHLPRL